MNILIKYGIYSPFAMDEMDSNIVFLLEVFRYMFGTINRAMLAACTAETNLQMLKTSFDKPLHMVIHQRIDMTQKGQNLTVLFQKINHRLVLTR